MPFWIREAAKWKHIQTHTFKVVLLTLFVVMLTIHSLLLGTFPTYSCFTVIQPDSWTLSLYPSWPQSHGIHTCGCLCTHSNLWTPTLPKRMTHTKCTTTAGLMVYSKDNMVGSMCLGLCYTCGMTLQKQVWLHILEVFNVCNKMWDGIKFCLQKTMKFTSLKESSDIFICIFLFLG